MSFPLRPAVWPALIASIAMTVLAPGCASDPTRGYSFASTYPQNIQTVHIPIFQNDTFSRGVEVELADAIAKEIGRSTPWRIVSEEGADAVLTGAITEARLRTLTTNRVTGLSQEVAVILTVDFDLRDARSGKSITARRNFSAAETFVPARPAGERLEVGEQATVQELAQAIVAQLRSNW